MVVEGVEVDGVVVVLGCGKDGFEVCGCWLD